MLFQVKPFKYVEELSEVMQMTINGTTLIILEWNISRLELSKLNVDHVMQLQSGSPETNDYIPG